MATDAIAGGGRTERGDARTVRGSPIGGGAAFFVSAVVTLALVAAVVRAVAALDRPHPAFAGAGVGEPEGGFFFLFAEFAMLCFDSRIDWRIWEQTLPSLIAPQEIFIHVYHPTPQAPPPVGAKLPSKGPVKTALDRYSFRNFKQSGAKVTEGVGQSDSARISDLRKKYRGMTFLQLRKALAQNMLRAQNMR